MVCSAVRRQPVLTAVNIRARIKTAERFCFSPQMPLWNASRGISVLNACEICGLGTTHATFQNVAFTPIVHNEAKSSRCRKVAYLGVFGPKIFMSSVASPTLRRLANSVKCRMRRYSPLTSM